MEAQAQAQGAPGAAPAQPIINDAQLAQVRSSLWHSKRDPFSTPTSRLASSRCLPSCPQLYTLEASQASFFKQCYDVFQTTIQGHMTKLQTQIE